MRLTVSRRSRDLRPLSRDRSATFFKIFSNCLKRLKNVVWQSADGRVTSDHCRVAVQWLFSKFSQIAWNIQKTLFDSRSMVAWPPTTVAWPLSDFYQNFPKLLETSKNVVWQSADGRVTSDHCRVTVQRLSTFLKNFPNCLKRPKKFPKLLETSKNVVWQSAHGRVTSDHSRVTDQRLFSTFSQIAWNVQKTLFDSRPMVAWPPTTVAWPFSDFFQNFPKLLETSKNVVWQSADGRVTYITVAWPYSDFFQNFPKSLETSKNVVWQSADGRVNSDHCRLTVQRIFSKKFLIAWNVEKTLFDSRPTVAWPPTTVTWPFSDFLQKIFWLLETSKKRCLTVGRWSRDLRPLSRDRSATFFKKFSHCLGKQLFDSRPTVASAPTWLERRKNVVWKSADCHVMVRLFSSRGFFSYGFTYCLADVYLVLIILSFRQKQGHVSPPTGMVRFWKFRHHIKARDRTKRIFDFGGKIPTRWFPMKGTSSPL